MSVAYHLSRPTTVDDVDHRVIVGGVSWKEYVVVREMLDTPGLRMTYDRGTLELMTPSRPHEVNKTQIARLLELWALLRGVRLYGYGSMTFKNERHERGLEPDECYSVGAEMKDAPDFALEVVHTRGGLSKLPIYASIGAREVWMFEDGAFRVFTLRDGGYVAIERSEVLKDLDLVELATFVVMPDQHDAVVAYRARLQG